MITIEDILGIVSVRSLADRSSIETRRKSFVLTAVTVLDKPISAFRVHMPGHGSLISYRTLFLYYDRSFTFRSNISLKNFYSFVEASIGGLGDRALQLRPQQRTVVQSNSDQTTILFVYWGSSNE
jgi:hypothetical protein